MKRYNATPWANPAQAMPEGAEWEQSQPARPADLVADLVVPIGQALFTGALVAGLVVFVVARTDYSGDLLTLGSGLFLGIAVFAWLLLLVDTRRLLWAIERLTGADLDGDGQAGNPAKQTLGVEVKEGRRTWFVDAAWLDLDDDNLLTFALGVHNGRGLTEGEWGKDRWAFPKGINQFRAVRGKLLEVGLLAKVNPSAENSTVKPTAAGRAFFRRLVEHSSAHTHERGA